jgi:hypothetical protein
MRFLLFHFLLIINIGCSIIDTNNELIFLGSPEQALKHISFRAHPINENGDVWQRPSTTQRTWKGDCEDWAGLYCSALIAYGESATIVAGWYSGPMGTGWHMAVKYKNKIISPQWQNPYMSEKEFTVWVEYTLEQYLSLCVK